MHKKSLKLKRKECFDRTNHAIHSGNIQPGDTVLSKEDKRNKLAQILNTNLTL